MFTVRLLNGNTYKNKTADFVAVHDVQPFSANNFNMTHNIRHISFGKSVPGKTNPLDSHSEVATEGKIPYSFFGQI
jgi:endoplasmic reticulum-Golgi intermediate compartment protein 3